jgi:uncharacterized membrane protein
VNQHAPKSGPRDPNRRRIDAVDELRGLVIALMVLDHTRDFFHRTALVEDPLSMDSGEPALFMARWITHLCAPTFVLLAGASVFLQQAAGRGGRELRSHLRLRGLWLVVLELGIVGLLFNFGPWLFFQVLWALGIGMIGLSFVIGWQPRAIAALAALILLLDPLLLLLPAGRYGWLQPLLAFGPMPSAPLDALVAYPALPWFGVLLLGYLAGSTLLAPLSTQRRRFGRVALVGLGLCIVLRAASVHGVDYRPWSPQPSFTWTMLSFVDVAKYPPSLLFVMLFSALAALLYLAMLTAGNAPWRWPLRILGRTALFTYLAHIALVHAMAVVVGIAGGVPARAFTNHLVDPSRLVAAQWGFGLPGTLAAWCAALALLLPLAVWYDRIKRRNDHRVLRYL